MHFVKYLLSISLILLGSSCAPAPTPTAAPTSTAPATLPPATSTPPTPENTPELQGGQWTYIFYHHGLEQIMLVNGGPERGKAAEEPLELWAWDGVQWSLVSAEEGGPTWRNWLAAAYDTARDVLVIHGGLQRRTNFDETWEWDGQEWTRFEGTGPGGREGALMAYDEARGQTILFGGSDSSMQIHGDTWAWDGQTWTKVSESGPAPRFPGGMVYDPARQEVVLYSGHFADLSGGAVDYDDLWSWNGSSWREISAEGPTPGHRTHSGFLFDPVMEMIVLIGSGNDVFLGDAWGWDGSTWEEIPASDTPARSGNNVAYDPGRDRFVLFGGVDRPGGVALQDTWEWDRESWVCVHNC